MPPAASANALTLRKLRRPGSVPAGLGPAGGGLAGTQSSGSRSAGGGPAVSSGALPSSGSASSAHSASSSGALLPAGAGASAAPGASARRGGAGGLSFVRWRPGRRDRLGWARASRHAGGRAPGNRPALRRADQAGQRERAGQRAEQRGQHVHRFGVRPGQRAGQADHGEDAEPEVAVAEPPHGRDADDRGQHREHHEHAHDQGLLVVRAERGDREVLDRGRSIVDGQTTDGGHRRALRPAYPSDELGDPERDPGGEQANPHTTADPRGMFRSFHRSHS